MRLHRFIGDFNLKSNSTLIISDPELLVQWKRVLRFGEGDELLLCDGNMNEARVCIKGIRKDLIEVKVVEVFENKNEPEKSVTLYAPLLKGEHFEMIVEKVVEVGVIEIVPVISSRTVKQNFRRERILKIIKEAAEQSGRGVLPVLHNPLELDEVIHDATKNDVNFFFDMSGDRVGDSMGVYRKIGVFIGPEGGWDTREIDLAREAGFCISSLGLTTLRAETAAVVAAYACIS